MGFFDRFKKKPTAVKPASPGMSPDPPPPPTSSVSQSNPNYAFGNYGVGTSGVLPSGSGIQNKNLFDNNSPGDLLEVPTLGQQMHQTASLSKAFSVSSGKEQFSPTQPEAPKETNFSYSASSSSSQGTGRTKGWNAVEAVPGSQDFSLPSANQPVPTYTSSHTMSATYNTQAQAPAMEKPLEPAGRNYQAPQTIPKIQPMNLGGMPEKLAVNDIEKVSPFSSGQFKSNMELRKLIDDEISSVEYMRTGVKPIIASPNISSNIELEKEETPSVNEEVPIEKGEKLISLDGQQYLNIIEFRGVIKAMDEISNDCRIGEQTIARIEELNHDMQENYNSWQKYIETFENDIIMLEKLVYKK